MAGSVLSTPGFDLTPSSKKVALQSNYITNFNFLDQYLPDTYEKEFERYGNRTVASFLRAVSAELPSNSDLIKWSEQGRLHTQYTGVTATNAVTSGTQILDIGDGTCVFRVGQTVILSSATDNKTQKAIIIDAAPSSDVTRFQVAYYENAGAGFTSGTADIVAFVYGSEFKKGTNGMEGSLEAESDFFENKPIIIKDKYAVNGSDMAQIGWVEVSTENGASGYLWYIKSEHETRLRFEDYLEMSMIEAVPAETGSGALAALSGGSTPTAGSEGMFYTIEERGNVWSGGNPSTLADFDAIIERLDKQGSIQENVLFLNRQFGFDIDDMLAAQNSYGTGGTSYGLFDNDEKMALNLGFSGFKRGYEFYKTDWKYLNDATLRGGLTADKVNGVLVPAGSMTVYDQVLGKNARRPFLHVRYRASETEDRRYKTWITGSAGGAMNSDLDAMEVHFLSERALCTMGANNFFLFKD
jgi:hypothetical protein